MPITRDSTLIDVCFTACTELQRAGTIAVLTGGSAATYYVPERYQSRDADFVITLSREGGRAVAALRELGFTEHGGIYHHARSSYTLDFVAGPLAIGHEVVDRYQTVKRRKELLHIISRTTSVCDRLAAFYHWSDRSSLRTAVDVARSGLIDLSKIKLWSQREGAAFKFAEFSRRYAEARSDSR